MFKLAKDCLHLPELAELRLSHVLLVQEQADSPSVQTKSDLISVQKGHIKPN